MKLMGGRQKRTVTIIIREPPKPLYHCPQDFLRYNEAVFSRLLHDEINLDEATSGQLVPLKDFMVQNDYFSDHFSKDYYVTSKHTYKRHISLAWFQVLN